MEAKVNFKIMTSNMQMKKIWIVI